MSKRPSTQRSLAAALGNENTPAASAAASPTGPEGSGDTRRALVLAQPTGLASPSASPEPKRSRSAELHWCPPPLLLTFKNPADKIQSFLRRRKRLEKTLFTLDDDLTLAQQQRRRELWPTYLQLRQTKAGQPVYWKGAAIYVGHKPWQATPAAPATPDAPA
eukprot:jgi/Mesvir1/10317/Mv06179-RA.1